MDPVSFHDEIAEQYADSFSEHSDHLEEFAGVLSHGDSVLDAGCGAGIDAGFLASEGLDVVGVDLSERMLELARENFPQVDFREKDLKNLDLPDSSFDGVVASFSLIFLPKQDVPKVIEDFRRLLDEGGVLFLGLQEGESRETEVETPEGEVFVNVVSEQEIKGILEEKGFSIVESFHRQPREGEFEFRKLYLIAEKEKQIKSG